MRKRILTLLCITMLILSMFSGCELSSSDKDDSENDRSEQNYADYDNGSAKGSGSPKKVTLTEVSNTGSIAYDYIRNIFTPASSAAYTDFWYNAELPDPELFEFSLSNRRGYVDSTGNIVFDCYYDRVESLYEDKAFAKLEDGSVCVINAKGDILYTLQEGYDDFLKSAFLNGKAFYVTREYPSFEFTVTTLTDDFELSSEVVFDSYAADGPLFLINTKEFCGFAIYHREASDAPVLFSIISTDGQILATYDLEKIAETEKMVFSAVDVTDSLNPDPERIIHVRNGYINVMNESGKWGLMDIQSGKMVIDYRFDYVGSVSEGRVNYCQNQKWGVIDLNGDNNLECQYNYVGPFSGGLAFAEIDDYKRCMINTKGQIVTEFDNDLFHKKYYVYPFNPKTGLTVLSNNGGRQHYVISSSGQCLFDSDDAFAQYISDHYILADNILYKIEVN